ncbi:MAG: hypothetical protein GY754_19725 [bacterium]|nr:hypothetical protein [bacterium]
MDNLIVIRTEDIGKENLGLQLPVLRDRENLAFELSEDIDFLISEKSVILKNFFDILIENEINFELLNFPLCLFLGHKRYMKKTKLNIFIDTCNQCNYNNTCSGLPVNYVEKFGTGELKPVNINFILTDNEQCMLKILDYKNNITTSELLILAKKFPICNDCSTGSHVVGAGEKLAEKNMITRNLTDKGYLWCLL